MPKNRSDEWKLCVKNHKNLQRLPAKISWFRASIFDQSKFQGKRNFKNIWQTSRLTQSCIMQTICCGNLVSSSNHCFFIFCEYFCTLKIKTVDILNIIYAHFIIFINNSRFTVLEANRILLLIFKSIIHVLPTGSVHIKISCKILYLCVINMISN